MVPEDKNFILATWLRGLYYGDSVFSNMRKSTFMSSYHAVIEHLLTKNANSIKVACLKDDPSVILGYAVLAQNDTTLHWAFTKKGWRSIGIIKDLLPNSIKYVTHLTKVGNSIVKSKGWEFNPFIN